MPIAPGTHVVYTVRPGDTLYGIAGQFGASYPDLVRTNAIHPPFAEPDLIFPGRKLLVRVPGMAQQSAVLHQVTEGDTMYGLAVRYAAGLDLLVALIRLEQPDILRVAQLIHVPAFVYEVEPGDSLFRIAQRFGVSLGELTRANSRRPGFSPDVLVPGYRLVVPLPSSENIVVFAPLPGTRIAAGDALAGAARAFEATVHYLIRDAAGRTVTRERVFMTSAGAPAFGEFQVPLEFDAPPAAPTGTILVFTRSARDGSVQDLTGVNVAF